MFNIPEKIRRQWQRLSQWTENNTTTIAKQSRRTFAGVLVFGVIFATLPFMNEAKPVTVAAQSPEEISEESNQEASDDEPLSYQLFSAEDLDLVDDMMGDLNRGQEPMSRSLDLAPSDNDQTDESERMSLESYGGSELSLRPTTEPTTEETTVTTTAAPTPVPTTAKPTAAPTTEATTTKATEAPSTEATQTESTEAGSNEETSATSAEPTPTPEPVDPSKSPMEISLSSFMWTGRLYWGGMEFTYYSQSVLPGPGLRIPGRHVNANGYVCDGDGYIVLASDYYARGTVISTPFGNYGKVYDAFGTGQPSYRFDVYIR